MNMAITFMKVFAAISTAVVVTMAIMFGVIKLQAWIVRKTTNNMALCIIIALLVIVFSVAVTALIEYSRGGMN